jgi:hypothetical protein
VSQKSFFVRVAIEKSGSEKLFAAFVGRLPALASGVRPPSSGISAEPVYSRRRMLGLRVVTSRMIIWRFRWERRLHAAAAKRSAFIAGLLLVVAGCDGNRQKTTPIRIPPPASATANAAIDAGGVSKLPSPAECESLWRRYHSEVEDDPYVTHEQFVARCAKSDRAVLECPERARAELEKLAKSSSEEDDAGAPPVDLMPLLVRIGMPSRNGICMTRERLRFALQSGELEALGHDAALGRLHPDADGFAVLRGDRATLPSRGIVETERSAELGPFGETRVDVRADGRAWLYFLGGLLGRHQNQVGFLYSSAPFVDADFRAEEGGQRVCLDSSGRDAGAGQPARYLLGCFTLIERMAPNLIEVGSAPD